MEREDRHKEQVRARSRAWYRAVRALIKNHQVEFDQHFNREAQQEGVSPQGSRTR